MTRRLILAVTAAVLLGGAAVPALADWGADAQTSSGGHSLCLMGSNDPRGPREGICVWIPTY